MEFSFKRNMIAFFFFIIFVGICDGVVHKVGDSAGWTAAVYVDYSLWSSSQNFNVGDTLVFEYNPLYINVVQVSRSEFHACTTLSPEAVYVTGNDSIVIWSPGHFFYISSFVGSCQAGQKLDVRVLDGPNLTGPPMKFSVYGPTAQLDGSYHHHSDFAAILLSCVAMACLVIAIAFLIVPQYCC